MKAYATPMRLVALVGLLAALCLWLLYWMWTSLKPGSEEGAYFIVSLVAYVLAFPVSIVAGFAVAELQGLLGVVLVSSLTVSLLSVPINWLSLAALFRYWSRRQGPEDAAGGASKGPG